MSQVVALYICANKGLPMMEVPSANAIAGKGFEGDRYSIGMGAWSKAREAIRHISLIEIEAIAEANKGLDVPFAPIETRRNIVVSGVRLNELVGKVFRIGNVEVRGSELCVPCARPSKLSGKPGFAEAFDSRGGLRVEVLSAGFIKQDDPIVIE